MFKIDMSCESSTLHWVFKPKKTSRQFAYMQRKCAKADPLHSIYPSDVLHPTSLQTTKSKRSKTALLDPLSNLLDGGDPLSELSLQNDPLCASSNGQDSLQRKNAQTSKEVDVSPIIDNTVSWEKTHSSILSKFVTKRHLTFASSYLQTSETGTNKVQSSNPDKTKSAQTGSERVKSRLEHFDTMADGSSTSNEFKEFVGLTQEQFTQHFRALKLEMIQAWDSEQRIKALKIVIQCVKSLSLSSPEMFYPYKFMLVTDILDELGLLVSQRVKKITDTTNCKLEADETRNMWLYKIASIREVLTRFYLEAALAHCLLSSPMTSSLERLVMMTRGIGDPIVNIYAKMYIARIGEKENVNSYLYIQKAIEDSFSVIKWGWNGNGITEFEVPKEETESSRAIAERVLSPPFQWLFQCLSKKAPPPIFLGVLKQIETCEGIGKYVILQTAMMKLSKSFLSAHRTSLLQLVSSCYHLGQSPCEMVTELASIVNVTQPDKEEGLALLNGAWQLIVEFRSLNDYLVAAAPWVQFVSVNFSCHELDKILSEVLKRISVQSTAGTAFATTSLLNLINAALSYTRQPEILCTIGSFQGLLSIFQRETLASGSGGNTSGNIGKLRQLLESILAKHPDEFSDPTFIQLLLTLFSSLHDGINALTTQDERRQISQLIVTFILKVNFGRYFEHQLQFYVDARASFSSLDSVLEALIHRVCALQFSTFKIVKGKHTGKTSAFEHACTAYCFITIPSLSLPLSRLKLYLLCGSVAMVNGCMGQGDTCIKSGIKEILELLPQETPSSTPTSRGRSQSLSALSDEVVSAIMMLSSYLIAIPDPPDASSPLYLFRGVRTAIRNFKGAEPPQYCRLSLGLIKGISSCTQVPLPYHFKGVEAADVLFGRSEVIINEAQLLCSELLNDIGIYLKSSFLTPSDPTAGLVAIELMELVMSFCDIRHKETQILTKFLLQIINRSNLYVKLKNDVLKRYEEILSNS